MMSESEGIDITNGIIRFIAQRDIQFFTVDLKKGTYCQKSTLERNVQSPDNIRYFGEVLYICIDGRTPDKLVTFVFSW